jgi:hypothetical protein
MKLRIFNFIIISLTIVWSTYNMRLINLDTSYFGKSIQIQYLSYFLTYILPFLIILLFFKRLIATVALTTTIILVLSFVYGLYSYGLTLFSNFLIWWIVNTLSIIVLCYIMYKDSLSRTRATELNS